MKLLLIARVSDVKQIEALPAQELNLRNYAKEYRANHPEITSQEYKKFDESAYKDDRRKFSELVVEISKYKTKTIVVFDKIDRFTRDASQKEVRIMGSLVDSGDIEMHFPSDNLFINRDSPATDKFRLGIGMLLAKYYSDSSRDNVKRRFAQMLNDGIWIGAAPIGYLNVNNGTKERPDKGIIVDEARAPHIAKMFEMRAIGLPYAHIAQFVNAHGLTSKSGKKITKASAEKILKNPFYYGTMLYMGKLYPHRYEPLISRHLYDQCQEIREKRHDQHTTYASLAFALKDMALCKYCGCTVTPYNSKDRVYLKCTGAKGDCGNVNTAQSLVMPDVTQTLGSIPFPTGALPLILEELRSRFDNQQEYYTHNIEVTRKDYDKIKDKLKNLTYERIEGRITVDIYDEIVNELTAKQQELNDRLISLTGSNKSFIVTASYLLDLAQRVSKLFEDSSERLQQKLLKFVLSNMQMADKKLTFDVVNPYKIFIEENKKAQNEPSSANWCRAADALLTAASELHEDYRLKDLVEQFNLSGELISPQLR